MGCFEHHPNTPPDCQKCQQLEDLLHCGDWSNDPYSEEVKTLINTPVRG